MKKAAIILLALLSGVGFTSCMLNTEKGNGIVKEEVRDCSKFDAISVTRGMNVYVTQGPETRVVVKADENLLDYIETDVSDRTLKVTCTKGIRNATSNKVFVTVPNLEMVKATAGSNFFTETPVKISTLEIKASAGSNIHFNMEEGEADVSASSGSNVFLSGNTKSMKAKANSGSNIKAGELQTGTVEARVSSGANIWLNVTSNLSARASSGGNIFYTGTPSQTDISKSSGGNVIKN
jgi:hypothetical protein